MIDETRLGRLLDGTRGAGPFDRPALIDAVVALCHAIETWPPGFELDLNPVAVLPTGQGVCVLDAAYVPALPAQPGPDPEVGPADGSHDGTDDGSGH